MSAATVLGIVLRRGVCPPDVILTLCGALRRGWSLPLLRGRLALLWRDADRAVVGGVIAGLAAVFFLIGVGLDPIQTTSKGASFF